MSCGFGPSTEELGYWLRVLEATHLLQDQSTRHTHGKACASLRGDQSALDAQRKLFPSGVAKGHKRNVATGLDGHPASSPGRATASPGGSSGLVPHRQPKDAARGCRGRAKTCLMYAAHSSALFKKPKPPALHFLVSFPAGAAALSALSPLPSPCIAVSPPQRSGPPGEGRGGRPRAGAGGQPHNCTNGQHGREPPASSSRSAAASG